MSDLAMPPLAVNTDIPVDIPPRRKPRKRRRKIGPATWSAIGAFVSRERFFLLALHPDSPRVRVSLARIMWLERQPGVAAVEREAA